MTLLKYHLAARALVVAAALQLQHGSQPLNGLAYIAAVLQGISSGDNQAWQHVLPVYMRRQWHIKCQF